MSANTNKTRGSGDELDQMPSDEIETHAIEDAIGGETRTTNTYSVETEQEIEYVEKREFAADERANVDPTEH